MARKKKIDFGFTPSEYQEKIFDFIQHGVGNAVISATAGSGKTSTAVASMKLIPKKQKCIFLAFNKAIANELSEKLKNNSNVTVRTSHSLGLLMIRKNIGVDFEIDEYKYRTYVKNNITELTTITGVQLSKKQIFDYIDSITSLIEYSRFNLAQTKEEINEVAKKYDIPVSFDECDVVVKCLEWGKTHTETIDYTDMLWLPVELDMKPIGLQYDWVMGDESQDFSKLSYALMRKCFKRGTRSMFIGDGNQCQPKGTKILMSDGTEKNIEDVKVGDGVVTYARREAYFRGYKSARTENISKVLDIENHKENEIITVYSENGLHSSYTPSHICYAKINSEKSYGKHILYLMCNEKGMYRIGVSRFKDKKNNCFGAIARMRSEQCNKCWILDIFDTDAEARKWENIESYAYGIPKLITDKNVIEIYDELEKEYSLKEHADKLLKKYGRDIRFPFYEQRLFKKISRNHISTYNACNLFPSIMDISYFDEKNIKKRTHGNNKHYGHKRFVAYSNITEIKREYGDFDVYSMEIEREHNYVADGILTHNCINLFAGSDEDAFNSIQNQPNTKRFELPISYRCAKKIVKYANKLVPSMLYKDTALDGEIIENCRTSILKDGDMVLCRTKAPLLTLYMRLLKRGVNCYIKGQDIGLNLIRMLDNIKKDTLNPKLDNDGVFVRLYDKLFNERNKLIKKRGLDFNDATLASSIMEMYDNINTLLTLSEDIDTKDELIERIRNIFKEDAKGVCLSTIHKAKGLESDNVYILCHSSMPSRNAKHQWEKIQERNLQYVAYTRAKKRLGFISEKEIPSSGNLQEPMAIINDLIYIENKICGILDKVPTEKMDNAEIARFNLRNKTKIEDLHKNDNAVFINKTNNNSNNRTNDDFLKELDAIIN